MKNASLKKALSVIIAAVMLLSVWTVCGTPAYAASDKVTDIAGTAAKAELGLLGADYNPQSEEVEQGMIDEAEALPDKIDLRDYNGQNYVTPVKRQDPFGSCWAFGIAAAAEISYLYDNDLGVPAGEVNNNVDFSEKYITWYMYHGITEDDVVKGAVRASQIGEGYDVSAAEALNGNAVYNLGGDSGYAPGFFASGFGPVEEDTYINGDYPYYYSGKNRWRMCDKDESEEMAALRKAFYKVQLTASMDYLIGSGTIQSEDEYDDWFESYWHEGSYAYDFSYSESNYAGYDDWSLPLNADYRTPAIASYFKNSYTLPAPAMKDENGDYLYNEVGVSAIKSQLAKGHGVAIGFLADQSVPGQEVGDTGYMNTTNWAQYYDGPVTLSHEVCIVGYDDNYPKENFTRKVNGEIVEGSTPPGDGAFIVKNSWGALTEEDKATVTYDNNGYPVYISPNASAWGFEDTGYFYLSYHDHSIMRAYSYEFYPFSETEYYEMNYDQYDLLPTSYYDRFESESVRKMANVFDAEEDEYLIQISTMTAVPGTTVHYEIYKDIENDDPASGRLLEEGEVTKDLAGYQRIDLKGAYFIEKGELYSVVITQSYQTDDDSTIYADLFAAIFENRPNVILNGVINPGESYLYQDGEWIDLSDLAEDAIDNIYQIVISGYGSEETLLEISPAGRDAIAIDNYPIKAFLVPKNIIELDYLLGDANLDNEVDVTDATWIRRYDLELEPSANLYNIVLADVDQDHEICIIDATWIQRWKLNLKAPEGIGKRLSS